ncbi:MAG: hypothetical protein ACTSWY_07575 [Promethearchaeota archaeon]
MDKEAKIPKNIGKKQTIHEFINEDNVYLIVDHNRKTIWLYKGINSSILNQFIGAEVQGLMKYQLRGFYSTRTLDEISPDSDVYQEVFKTKIKEGRAKEIIKIKEDKSVGLSETLPKDKKKIDINRAREICVHKGVNPRDILPEVQNLKNPPGYHRHMTLIGSSVYNERHIIEKFLTEQIDKTELKKIGNLPNGFFFIENISSRILIKKGKIHCIDFMAKNGQFMDQTNRLMVPIFHKDKFHRDGDAKILLKSFKEPKVEDDKTSEEV